MNTITGNALIALEFTPKKRFAEALEYINENIKLFFTKKIFAAQFVILEESQHRLDSSGMTNTMLNLFIKNHSEKILSFRIGCV
jgi:hypothetical protein